MDQLLVNILFGIAIALVGIAVLIDPRPARTVLAGIGLGIGAVVALIELFAKMGG